ncbi:CopG family transcriptional regulator [Scytonema sp. PCC 10023]|uniref:CopG family transcriptional regulator n=1 Tax=Scytonema sp. PCC 10023 TaxID=1680591 RepID=UPI0039C738CF
MGAGRGRPGGNPDFGTKYRFDFGNKETRDQVVAIRFSASELEKIKAMGGDRYREFCRNAILEALKQAN